MSQDVIVGLDFDNTIVCYDTVFHTVASERGLVPPEPVLSKDGVRGYLRSRDQETTWIELQGIVYGSEILKAPPFPGALEFIADAVRMGMQVFIISHKTRTPFAGPPVNLHDAARAWLAQHKVFDFSGANLPESHAFFEETLQGKLERIRLQRCTHFVDDLPELLAEDNFPPKTKKVLFDPSHRHHSSRGEVVCLYDWDSLHSILDKDALR